MDGMKDGLIDRSEKMDGWLNMDDRVWLLGWWMDE